MKAVFIANGIGTSDGKPGISGGDVRWIEIANKWQEFGLEIHVLTQKAGVDLCKRLNLEAKFHTIDVPPEYSFKSYIYRAFRSYKIPRELESFNGIIYATTEHWYDVIPGTVIKKNNPENKFAVVAHWVAPLRRRGTSLLNGILFYINQRMGYIFAKKYADVILAVSQSTKEAILQKIRISKEKIKVVKCGVSYENIKKISSKSPKKEYDGVFMKRFDGTKGVFDVVEIWKNVVAKIPKAKLIMIGHGTKENLNKLKSMIEERNLEENIRILGPIYDFEEKIKNVAKSRVFLLPSYEENWAIVIGEAMACGTPIICYDLPEIRPIWRDNIIWVPKGDRNIFAQRVLEFLINESIRKKFIAREIEFVKQYDWKDIAKKELNSILE